MQKKYLLRIENVKWTISSPVISILRDPLETYYAPVHSIIRYIPWGTTSIIKYNSGLELWRICSKLSIEA